MRPVARRLLLFLLAVLALQAPARQAFAEIRPLDAELTQFKYPYEVFRYSFKAQGQNLSMAYMDVRPAADAANGRTAVLLHGKNFSGAYWQPTIEALSAQGYRVIVPDQIGFGKSTKPDHLQYSFQALASWTQALLTQLKIDRYLLVGHSMGGMLATRMALMYPDRVEKLALVNPIGLEDWKRIVPYRTADEWYARELTATPETIRAYQKQSYYDGKWNEDYEKSIEMQAGWTLHADYPRVAWNSALTYDMIMTQPVLYEFGDLKTPVLLLIGTRDRTALGKDAVTDEKDSEALGRYDRLGKKAAAAIPQARLVEFEGVGHLPQVEVFDLYIEALENFLAEK